MSRHEQYTAGGDSDSPIHKTSARFNLASLLFESKDIVIKDAETNFRIIQYEFDHSKIDIFDALMEKKLILGNYLPHASDGEAVFSVPLDSRPLAYEVGTAKAGQFTYGDQRLFSELGSLLSITHKVTNGMVLPAGLISRSVAFVDLTLPYEHNLFLVPGVERLLVTGQQNAIDYYLEGLKQPDEMGHRFHAMAANEFIQAFNRVALSGK